jgi:ribosomal protein S18 acetylase RimI-like enzyme
MPPLTMMKLPPNFVLRSFQLSDEADCHLLEQRANQHRNPKFQKIPIIKQLLDTLQVYPHYPKGHETKAKLLSQEYEIIVCEDTEAKRVVATVACHISRVSFSSSSSSTTNDEKVGWVHGLRVDESYQRRGLGTALQQELERRCLARHVNMLYLTVNNDNQKAKSLYRALSYQHASHRSSSTKFLMKAKEFGGDEVLVVRLTDVNLAAAITAQHYKDCDLCPVPAAANKRSTPLGMVQDGFVELFNTPEQMYQGTFVAVKRSELPEACVQLLDGSDMSDAQQSLLHEALKTAICQESSLQNYGVISLWSSSAVKGFKVVRLGVTKETWLSSWFQLTMLLSITAVLTLWSKRVISNITLATAAGWQWSIKSTNANAEADFTLGWAMTLMWFILGVVEFLLLCLAIRLTLKAYKVFQFMISRNSCKLQSRAFAPYHVGPEGIDCLRAALMASQVHAQREGFVLWVLNVAEDGEYGNKFGKGFKTQFWQKWLVKGREEQEERHEDDNCFFAAKQRTPFSASAFCDPRHF